jgi:hypothetical protein
MTLRACGNRDCPVLHRNTKYCSYRCRNVAEWYALTPDQRSEKGKRIARLRQAQSINRMIQRVRVLADTEPERLILAWRYGLRASKVRRYRASKQVA